MTGQNNADVQSDITGVNKDSAESLKLKQDLDSLKQEMMDLKANIAANTKKENIEFNPSQTNTNKEVLTERQKGASLSRACDLLERNILEYKDSLPTVMKESVENFLARIEKICVAENGLVDEELKRDQLAFLNCKTFFDIEGMEVPEHLKNKVDKVKQAKSYSLTIKDEIDELLSHIPYMTKRLRELEERKRNANIILDEFGNAQGVGSRGDSYYLNSYFTGKTTLEECKKNLSPHYKEKIKMHLLANAKRAGYEPSPIPAMSIQNYASAFEPVDL